MANAFGGYMEVGHHKTDREHLLLFVNIAQLSNAHSPEDALRAIKDYHSNFILHCANEEIFMRQIKNPTINEHIIEHIKMKETITRYISKLSDYENASFSYISNILDKELSVHLTDWDSYVFKRSKLYDPNFDIESGFGL